MRIYTGNLAYDVTEEEIKKAFGTFGTVDSVTVVNDRDSGRPKGFAFVDMPNKAEAEAAISGLNNEDLKGRNIVVNEARPRTENRDRISYGNRSSGNYRGGRAGGIRSGYSGGGRGRSRR
jgi:RNA recognition motif-containing protein